MNGGGELGTMAGRSIVSLPAPLARLISSDTVYLPKCESNAQELSRGSFALHLLLLLLWRSEMFPSGGVGRACQCQQHWRCSCSDSRKWGFSRMWSLWYEVVLVESRWNPQCMYIIDMSSGMSRTPVPHIHESGKAFPGSGQKNIKAFSYSCMHVCEQLTIVCRNC